jgi:hypothetical protein
MRTTVRLDDELLYRVKLLAAQSGKTMTVVIEDALREVLARQDSPHAREPVRVTTVSGNGPQPGVDLDDSASLLALMEEPDGLDRR